MAERAIVVAMRKLTSLLLNKSLPTTTFRLFSFSSRPCQTPCDGTFLPPSPSTILPVLTSTTLDWQIAPRNESSNDPHSPRIVMANVNSILESQSQVGAFWPASPSWQNGRSDDATTLMMNEPRSPASSPLTVTPPFVPRGTVRQGAVMSRGSDVERIPSSEENVSAATAT
jgi:hypothetical protein